MNAKQPTEPAPNGTERKAAVNDFIEIAEGKAKIIVPKANRTKRGPGKIDAPVFYNPAMEQNRGVSVLVFQSLTSSRGRHIDALDGLAASGIRGIRFCKEVSGDFSVTINDWSQDAFELIKRNVERNRAEGASRAGGTAGSAGCAAARNSDLNALLCERKFDYIDIDPFGTPVDFIDSAVRAVRHKGILGITATDTAALCGAGSKACIRRYGAKPLHCEFMHETGLRILAGYVVRTAAKYDRAALPLLCYAEGHYMRCYFEIKDGAQKADALLKKIGFAHYCRKCGRRRVSNEVGIRESGFGNREPRIENREIGSQGSEIGSRESRIEKRDSGSGNREPRSENRDLGIGIRSSELGKHLDFAGAGLKCTCKGKAESAGPLWTGALSDGAFLDKLDAPKEIAEKKDVAKLLSIWRRESGAPPLYYTTGEIASLFHIESPAIEDAAAALKSNGFFACRTHFDPTGFKTDAPFEALADMAHILQQKPKSNQS